MMVKAEGTRKISKICKTFSAVTATYYLTLKAIEMFGVHFHLLGRLCTSNVGHGVTSVAHPGLAPCQSAPEAHATRIALKANH
jgi:hypothetical protein